MDTLSKFIFPGIVLLLALASGFWLSNAGKPLNSIIFNIHKLIALGAVIVITIRIVNVAKSTELAGLLLGVIVLAVMSVLALFTTGAMMSIGKVNYNLMLTIHRAGLFLIIAAFASMLYLLNGRIS